MNFWNTLPKPFFVLAPMDGVTDVVFRHIVSLAAKPDVFFSEFTNAACFASPKGRQSTHSRLLFTPDEQPMAAQIWGTNPDNFRDMAKGLAGMGYAGIDINMGCPVKDVVKTGACSALIETPTLAAELIAAAKEGGLPVSVKTRIGFREAKTEEWLGFLLQQNIVALTVHARTAKEMSKVPAHWEEVTKAVHLRNSIAPQTLIIGNGDVMDRAEGMSRIAETNADGIMIGRGVFQNVFCFEPQPRTHETQEYINLLLQHLDLFDATWQHKPHATIPSSYHKLSQVQYSRTSAPSLSQGNIEPSQAEHRAFAPLKRFFKIYIKGFAGASEVREALMHTNSTDEARKVLAKIV